MLTWSGLVGSGAEIPPRSDQHAELLANLEPWKLCHFQTNSFIHQNVTAILAVVHATGGHVLWVNLPPAGLFSKISMRTDSVPAELQRDSKERLLPLHRYTLAAPSLKPRWFPLRISSRARSVRDPEPQGRSRQGSMPASARHLQSHGASTLGHPENLKQTETQILEEQRLSAKRFQPQQLKPRKTQFRRAGTCVSALLTTQCSNMTQSIAPDSKAPVDWSPQCGPLGLSRWYDSSKVHRKFQPRRSSNPKP